MIGYNRGEITEFQENGYIKVKIYIDFFIYPIPSKDLVNSESFYEEMFRTDQIYAKLLNIPYKNQSLLVPLVHRVG